MREVDGGRDGGERGGREKQRDSDPDFGLGAAAQAIDRGRGIGAQPLHRQEVQPAKSEQHQKKTDLGADHDAIGGAVEPLPVADIEHTHNDAAGEDAGHAGH